MMRNNNIIYYAFFMIHIIKYLKYENIANETAAFYFTKPSDFIYKAGQFGDFTIINPAETDPEGNTRTFSILSAPSEENIVIATRLRDTAFKRNLKNFLPGTELIFDAPLGVFTLHADANRPAVFLAGGIGITPFRSMIADATEKKLNHKIFLFFSNKTPADAPYLDELFSLQKANPNFNFIPVMTQAENNKLIKPAWSGETGHLDSQLLDKYISDLKNPIFYLAGPKGMVRSLQKILNDRGVKNDDIKIEEFSGY